VRRARLAAVLVCLALPACTTQERPEGIAERWLLALNQGAAGEPGRYAQSEVSNEVLSNWERLDPGELDVIEVGNGSFRCEVYIACETRVPFRVVRLDGTEVPMDAIIPSHTGPPGGSRRVVIELVPPDRRLRLPSEGGPPIETASTATWLLAAAVGLGLTAISVLALRLAGARAQRD